MSRIGKKPINIPSSLDVKYIDNKVVIKGKNGELMIPIHESVKVELNKGEIIVKKIRNSKIAQSMNGTTVRLIQNMIMGLTEGFEKKIELNGVGYRMTIKGKQIEMALGFSHPVFVEIPNDLNVNIDGMIMTVSGIDKQRVGQFSANIRSLKPVEPYKGKGFRYVGEFVKHKEGKKATS